jgi:hypothetical protein
MKPFPAICFGAAVLLVSVLGAPATIIYFDPLNGSGDLDATSPSDRAGGTGTADWAASDDIGADGAITVGGNGSAWLPFTPQQGRIYQLSADVDVGPSEENRWLSIGFAKSSADVTAAFFSDPPGGYGHILYKPDRGATAGSVFLGEGTAGQGADFDPVDSGAMELTVWLDTVPSGTANWAFSFFADGSLVDGPHTLGDVGSIDDPGSIQFVGITKQNTSNGLVKNFSLSIIPEPASVLLLLLSAAAVFGLRRLRG